MMELGKIICAEFSETRRRLFAKYGKHEDFFPALCAATGFELVMLGRIDSSIVAKTAVEVLKTISDDEHVQIQIIEKFENPTPDNKSFD